MLTREQLESIAAESEGLARNALAALQQAARGEFSGAHEATLRIVKAVAREDTGELIDAVDTAVKQGELDQYDVLDLICDLYLDAIKVRDGWAPGRVSTGPIRDDVEAVAADLSRNVMLDRIRAIRAHRSRIRSGITTSAELLLELVQLPGTSDHDRHADVIGRLQGTEGVVRSLAGLVGVLAERLGEGAR